MFFLVQELCKHCEQPLVFPLSNPTDKAEITAENAYKWSKCNCVFAAGGFQCASHKESQVCESCR